MLEPLESRQLFDASFILDPSTHTLMLAGNAGDQPDYFQIEMTGANYRLTINGITTVLPFADIDAISVNCGDGNDYVALLQLEAPVDVYGGGGSDTLDLASGSQNLEWLSAGGPGGIEFQGGGGASDKLVLHDGAAAVGHIYAAGFDAISRSGWNTSVVYDAVDTIELTAGSAADEFDVPALLQGVQLRLYGGGGNDYAEIGDHNVGLDNVSGSVFFRGDAGYDTLRALDANAGPTRSDTYTITQDLLDRTGGTFGTIFFDKPELLQLYAQNGDNTIDVLNTGIFTNYELYGGLGNDTAVLGATYGDLDNVLGHVGFNGQAGTDAAVLFDTATPDGNAGHAYVFQFIGVTITNSTFGGFSYSNTEDLTLHGTPWGDSVVVTHTKLGVPLHLNTGAGDDAVTIGNGFLDLLLGTVYVDTGVGTDELIVDDEHDDYAYDDEYVITHDHLTRTAFVGMEFHNVEWSSLHASRGNNVIRVNGGTLFQPWTFLGGEGNDDFIVAGSAKVLDYVPGSFSFLGGIGTNTLTLNDSRAFAASKWMLHPGFLTRGPLAGGEPTNVIEWDNLATLTIEGGPLGDIFEVDGTLSYTSTIIRGGGNGGYGYAATGIDAIWVDETDANSPITLLPNLGAKAAVAVNVDGAGVAGLRFTESQSLHALTIAGGGRATLAAGSGIYLRLPGIPSFIGSGVLDLTDNDLIIDYPGPGSPIGAPGAGGLYYGVTGMIQRGYNGGDWSGTAGGIVTSKPAAAAGLTTIAIAEAADVLGISGGQTGQFDGATVDATTLLIKYTYTGDANLDGLIDAADYGLIDNWIQFPGTSGYFNGDFNYDGVIDAADYGYIDNNIQVQGPPL